MKKTMRRKTGRKTILILSIMIVLGLASFGFYCATWKKLFEQGHEIGPEDVNGIYLSQAISDDIGFPDFQPNWVSRTWVNGFREHTYLFLIGAKNGQALQFRQHVENHGNHEGNAIFANGDYLRPSTPPEWWDTPALDTSHSFYFRSRGGGRWWRFTTLHDELYVILVET